ncbi:MAG: hypothetical protein U9R66_02010 [Thermodesulfobacteriota bacterium]|nr:hypothetical protein [Thermodesulfobacteriota bacterium]
MKPIKSLLAKNSHFPIFPYPGRGKRKTWTVHMFYPVFALFLLSVFSPAPAYGVQVHSAPEGLYVHQMAHLFFAGAMLFLFIYLKKFPLGHSTAWRYIRLSLFFFFLWNINALIVHTLEVYLPQDAIIAGTDFWSRRLAPPFDLTKWVYFFTKHDHIWCVPAIFFLFFGTRSLYRETAKRLSDQGRKE